MHTVNVRQLKNNPSEALRKAQKEMVVVMNGDHPSAVLVHLEDNGAVRIADTAGPLLVLNALEGILARLGKSAGNLHGDDPSES